MPCSSACLQTSQQSVNVPKRSQFEKDDNKTEKQFLLQEHAVIQSFIFTWILHLIYKYMIKIKTECMNEVYISQHY